MLSDVTGALRLTSVLRAFESVAIAVSGGVDSVTLAAFAHEVLGGERVLMLHAVSPAVPTDATARLERLAAERSWNLRRIDARELEDPSYVANPLNRCFFCKTSLYSTMRAHTERPLLSGTNTDDLRDFRPGLAAARDEHVRHPFVEADMSKAAVRTLARTLQLGEIAELPASPCLSSRIETGIRIAPRTLQFVQAVETLVRGHVGPLRSVRCRVRRAGIIVELDGALDGAEILKPRIAAIMAEHGVDQPLSFAAYVVGSAFLRS